MTPRWRVLVVGTGGNRLTGRAQSEKQARRAFAAVYENASVYLQTRLDGSWMDVESRIDRTKLLRIAE
jgi:hypothetical protein